MMRKFVLVGLSLLSAGMASTAVAQAYPNRSVRIIVPFATGGPDTIARLVGAQFTQALGQPFVIENRLAANGIVGADAVAKATPDGYMLLITSSGFVGAPSLYKKLPYDTVADFTSVTNIAANLGTFLVVHPSVPANTVQEFIALAKSPMRKSPSARLAPAIPCILSVGSSTHGPASICCMSRIKAVAPRSLRW